MLLGKYISIGRETKDLDFSIEEISNEINIVQAVFDEIVKIEVGDGFVFTTPIVSPLEHFHMQYPGARVKMKVCFGKARFPLYIDLGFGDSVKVKEEKFLLLSGSRGPLFEPSISLKCYPVEFIFAEKFETVIHRGAENSRMKDFHDLYTLVSSKGILSKKETLIAIQQVFEHRGTPLRRSFQCSSSEIKALQTYWGRYHQMVIGARFLPPEIGGVIKVINSWIEREEWPP